MAKKERQASPQAPQVPFWSGILHQALTLLHAGRLPESENLYRQILFAEPDRSEAMHYLSIQPFDDYWSQYEESSVAIHLAYLLIGCRLARGFRESLIDLQYLNSVKTFNIC